MSKPYFDVGVVIALPEEFGYVRELLPHLKSIQYEGTHFYRLDVSPASAICCLVGQMGTLPAANAANRLLTFADVKVLVLLGLAGAVDDGVDVGDVVVADEVNEFQASSKAQPTVEGYEVQYSGRHWSLEFAIKEGVRHFEYSYPEGFSKWQAQVADDFSELNSPNKDTVCSLPAKLHIGPIASGNIVAASSAFLEEVRRINRKFVAIDMEAAGVASAASERIHPVQWLVVRGVSDRGDEKKKALDDERRVWRRYCVRNAIGLLQNLLTWKGFRAACGLESSAKEMGDEYTARDLILLVRSHVGAPWLVGVAFGLYSHGPEISAGGTVIPMDLSRLRVMDPRINQLMQSSMSLKERLIATRDLQIAAEGFVALADGYRRQLGSNGVDLLLCNFDRVVTETMCPSDDEEIGAVLLEADRREEDIGPHAAAEYLSEFPRNDLRLRQRYVETLSVLQDWSGIIDVLNDIEHERMSRSELDNLIFGYANTRDFGSAAAALRSHRYRYDEPSAQIFRQTLLVQFLELRNHGDEGDD